MLLWGTVHCGLVVSALRIHLISRLCLPRVAEWGLSTQFNATDEFLVKWADAQKFSYGKGAGWIVSIYITRINLLKLTVIVSSGISR